MHFVIRNLLTISIVISGAAFINALYVDNSGIGYIVAVAIPLHDINDRRVYVAFNFEAHFGLPSRASLPQLLWWQKFLQGKKKRDIENLTQRTQHLSTKNNVYTRRNFYRLIEHHLKAFGYNGTACLLRTICETSENPIYEYNGVFGNLFHILFTPSSSKDEYLPSIYSEAEIHGTQLECQLYRNDCPTSLLNKVSKWITLKTKSNKDFIFL